jgi:HEAT repeat protein
MASAFENLRRFGPGAFVLRAVVAAAVADVLLLAFILLRRTYRKWYFARRDARVFELQSQWNALIGGQIPYETWRTRHFDRRIVETIALDRFEVAGREESARLLAFLRASGLIATSIFEARHHLGWRRHRALVALGRTRAPEGIPALAEGLRDRSLETRLAALRGLERIASPEAAQEILNWMLEGALQVPALPLQSALVQCCAERPRMLLPYLEQCEAGTREVLARVLGEIATPSIGAELLRFADDELAELRAAVARALAHCPADLAVDALTQLAADAVWFVRLRAIVSLGELHHRSATASLLCGLSDSHRLVRLRAAEALVAAPDRIAIFEATVARADRYALHAYLAALDNAGLQTQLESDLQTMAQLNRNTRDMLLEVLRTGGLPSAQLAVKPLSLSASSAS